MHRGHIWPSFNWMVRSLASIIRLLHESNTFFAAATYWNAISWLLSCMTFLLVRFYVIGWSGPRWNWPQRRLRSSNLRIFNIPNSCLTRLFPLVITNLIRSWQIMISSRRFEEIICHLWRSGGPRKDFYSILPNLIFCDHIILIAHEPRIGRAATLS